ncbi:MAG: glycosyltransferase family 4 protein [Acidobacteria bacterium]|nr:glycosyltransferase family 4 protein [Acidobacteriota bacterium]
MKLDKIGFVSCWAYLRIYSVQAIHLKETLEKRFGLQVDVRTSNCGCFYTGFSNVISSFSNYESVLASREVQFIKLPYFRAHPEKSFVSQSARLIYRSITDPIRGKLYAQKDQGYPIIHFHQSADAFSIDSLKWLLHYNKNHAKTVVTVHRLSAEQETNPVVNQTYNGCDAVVVDTEYLKKRLMDWGVKPEKIHLIKYGAFIEHAKYNSATEAIMFAGSPLINVKGFEYLAPALRILKEEGNPLRVKLHGFHMPGHQEWADDIIKKEGIGDIVRWLKIANEQELIREYQNSLCSLVPYTNYPGSFPASLAMANGIPVVTSDDWGTQEYLDGTGLVFKSRSVEDLAMVLRTIRDEEALRKEMGQKALQVAERDFSWERISQKYFELYQSLTAR